MAVTSETETVGKSMIAFGIGTAARLVIRHHDAQVFKHLLLSQQWWVCYLSLLSCRAWWVPITFPATLCVTARFSNGTALDS